MFPMMPPNRTAVPTPARPRPRPRPNPPPQAEEGVGANPLSNPPPQAGEGRVGAKRGKAASVAPATGRWGPLAPGWPNLVDRVLYRDGLVLVVDKPAGIPVHAGPGGGANLEHWFPLLRFG